MHSNYKLWLIAIIATLFVACDADIDAFDRSPAQRNAESIAALKAELTAAEYGWRVLYFPRTDSLLFSNPSELIPQFGFRGRYGYGGHCFSMKFHADNTLDCLNTINERVQRGTKQLHTTQFCYPKLCSRVG